MKYALIGNNDGPLRLFKALQKNGLPLPEFVGLQKKPDVELLREYKEHLKDVPFEITFEETELIDLLAPKNLEVIINCFCNFKFTQLLDLYYCYNVHPSYLPRYRGRHPLHWALINGEKTHGITVHEMSKDYDDGPIIWQQEVVLDENMSVGQLRELLMCELEIAFPKIFTEIMEKKVEKRPNSSEKSTYIKRRSPQDSRLSEWNDAAHIFRKIKALRSEEHPAFLQLENTLKLPIIDVAREEKIIFSEEETLPALIKTEKNRLLIKTADKHLLWLFSVENQLNHPKIDFTL